MEPIICLKNVCEDDFEIEFEVLPAIVLKDVDEEKKRIFDKIASVDEQLEENQKAINVLNENIDKLTNHADEIDYMVAVGSGVLAGLIDIVFVKDFSFDKANEWGDKAVDKFVVKIAKLNGYSGDDLSGAVKYLENKFPIAADKATNSFGGGLQHHLRDFSHHPTPVGLFFSLLTQFTGKVFGTDVAGVFKIVDLKAGDLVLIGKDLPEKLIFGIINWFFHMVSDMAGSSTAIGNGKSGTGLPGPIVSLLKEVSALPIFKNMNEKGYKEFSVWISKLFNGTLLGKRDEAGKLISAVKFDLRTEIGVVMQLGKQAIPVVVNECIVRGFYFIRRLCVEIRNNNIKRISDFDKIYWKKVLPFKNRTIVRMLTISTGTMTAIDVTGAAIEAAAKSGGTIPGFVSNMIMYVNFIGLGRFAIALGTDVGMGISKHKLRDEKIHLMNQSLFLLGAKVYYRQGNMWISAEKTEIAMQEMSRVARDAILCYLEAIQEINEDMKDIGKYMSAISKQDPQWTKEMKKLLRS